MIEIEEFLDFNLLEGRIWIGDLSELLVGTALQNVTEALEEGDSYKGYTCTYKRYIEFFIVDHLLDHTLFTICKGRERCEEEVDDVMPEDGHIVIIHEDQLLGIVREIEDLDSGAVLDLPSASDIKITVRGVQIGEHYFIDR